MLVRGELRNAEFLGDLGVGLADGDEPEPVESRPVSPAGGTWNSGGGPRDTDPHEKALGNQAEIPAFFRGEVGCAAGERNEAEVRPAAGHRRLHQSLAPSLLCDPAQRLSSGRKNDPSLRRSLQVKAARRSVRASINGSRSTSPEDR